MMAAILRWVSPIAAATLLTACDVPSIDSCYSCIDAPSDRPIPAALQSKVRLIHGGHLPEEAQQVFYSEMCGIDCHQQLRFDASTAVVEGFVQRLLPQAPAQPAAHTSPTEGPAWWAAQHVAGTQVRQSGTEQPWPLTIVTLPIDNGQTRVWLSAFQT